MRFLIFIVLVAAVAAYFTRPDRDAMSAAANHYIGSLNNPLEAAGAQIGGAIEGRSYDDYYVLTRYTVGNDVTCWGAFKQVTCSHNKPSDQK